MKSILNYSKILILISVVIIISGLSVIFKYGFNLSIEYTGGSVFEISKEGLNVSETISNLKNFLDEKNIKYKSIDANGGYLAIKLEETDNNKTIEINQDYAPAYNNRAITKIKKDNAKGALEDLDKAIKLDADYANAYVNRGTAKEMLRDEAGACADWKKARELGADLGKKYLTNSCIE